jgi:hypothetical protein
VRVFWDSVGRVLLKEKASEEWMRRGSAAKLEVALQITTKAKPVMTGTSLFKENPPGS